MTSLITTLSNRQAMARTCHESGKITAKRIIQRETKSFSMRKATNSQIAKEKL
jgi:peptidyl-tRNA hydrolase